MSWKVKVTVTLTDDDHTEEEREFQVQIEESIPDGFQNLDVWEQDVRKIGFRTMRKLFKKGIELYEKKVLATYIHRNKGCQMQRRGFRNFLLRTVFGRVKFHRQRMFCKTCGEWVIPINSALGLHDEEQERATVGFKELSCLHAIRQPYRQAAETVGQVAQDPQIVSHEQIRQIVGEEGRRVREKEESDRKDAVFCFIKSLQNGQYPRFAPDGRFYICLDGVFVYSNAGKGRCHEGKVGFLCNDDRQSAGRRVKIPIKRYVSSFEDSNVLGDRVRGEALKLAVRLYREIFIIGDGARWIRDIWKQYFPEAVYILDWYHLHRNLYAALKLTLPYDETLRKELHRKVSKYLWNGLRDSAQVELKSLRCRLLSENKQELLSQSGGLDALIEYIESNWDGLVNYSRMYKSGYLIASSLVEKAADLVVAKRQKKKQSMHWDRMGADNISAMRTLWLNRDWKDYWRERREKAA